MTVRLRPHHLLCMLTFVGEGYTPAFADNYRRLAARLSRGEVITVVTGPDDVCAPLLGEDGAHCHNTSVQDRDASALSAVVELLGRPLAPGDRIAPDAGLLARLRTAFAADHMRSACHGCEWTELCTRIAGSGFAGVLVAPRQSPNSRC